jgi:hypothetical protein
MRKLKRSSLSSRKSRSRGGRREEQKSRAEQVKR